MKKGAFLNVATIMSIAILAGFFLYLVMVYPEIRQEALTGDVSDSITITSEGFTPNTKTISEGTTIRWINMDSDKHQIVGAKFSSKVLSRGQSYTYKFKEAGVYEYVDSFNQGLRGRIVVTE